jgi:hypothetical protein
VSGYDLHVNKMYTISMTFQMPRQHLCERTEHDKLLHDQEALNFQTAE